MKNKLVILAIAVFALILTACGSQKEVTYELVADGSTTEITYEAKGDKVTKQKTKQSIDYSLLGVSTKEEAEEAVKQEESMNEELKKLRETEGISHHITYKDDHLIEEIEIDTTKVDFNTLSEITGGELDKDSDYISLKESIVLIEQQGFTEKQ